MKHLVTGGAGFIGSHLTDKLLAQGHEVIVIDNLSEGKREYLPSSPHLQFHRLDILRMHTHVFEGVDTVFHFAAITRPQESIEQPDLYNRINVEGTLKVLMHAKEANVRRVVFASSASIYGEQPTYPCLETFIPNPMSPYGAQKHMGELYCKLYDNVYNLQTNSLRFFNAYGARMNPDSPYSALIPKFIKKIRNGERPVIFGHGNQARDFCHIDDVTDAIIKSATSETHGEVFNVGGGKNYSVNHVFNVIRDALGSDIEPIHGEPVIEPTQTLADITKTKELLGWTPQISIQDGIAGLIQSKSY